MPEPSMHDPTTTATAEMFLCRAEAAEAEVERLRKGLRQIVQWATYGYQDLNSGGVLSCVRKLAADTLDEVNDA